MVSAASCEKDEVEENWKRWHVIRSSAWGSHCHFRALGRSIAAFLPWGSPHIWIHTPAHCCHCALCTVLTCPKATVTFQWWVRLLLCRACLVWECSFLEEKTLFKKKNTILLTAPWNWENESEIEKASPTRYPSLGGLEVQHPVSRQPPSSTRSGSLHFVSRNEAACFFGITEEEENKGSDF